MDKIEYYIRIGDMFISSSYYNIQIVDLTSEVLKAKRWNKLEGELKNTFDFLVQHKLDAKIIKITISVTEEVEYNEIF